MLRHVAAGVGAKVMEFVVRPNVAGANASHKVLVATARSTAEKTFILDLGIEVWTCVPIGLVCV
jgi:hypothetical protein